VKILAIDPGGTTGWALLDTATRDGSAGVVRGHEWEHVDFVVNAVCDGWCDVLVLEDFKLRADLHAGAKLRDVTLSPVRINFGVQYALYRAVTGQAGRGLGGMLEKRLDRRWASESGGLVVKQSAADAKGFATDARLRRWGLYVTPEHARDAMRHAVLYAARSRKEEEPR
jgi:hypothetical protein